MNYFGKRILSSVLALTLTASAIPAASAYSAVSGWAKAEIDSIEERGLIPAALDEADLRQSITRLDMCRVAVQTYEKLTNHTVELTGEHPFTDTTDPDAEKAYILGLIKGDGDGTFRPDDSVIRLEMFCFISQFMDTIGYQVNAIDYADLGHFADCDQVPSWAKDQTRLAVGLGIIQGDGEKLDVNSDTTGEEALLIFERVYDYALGLDMSNPVNPQITKGEEIATYAQQFVGYPYVYGAKSPSQGFDCSGLMYYVYKQFGYTINPGAQTQWKSLPAEARVSRDALIPGDLVFFSDSDTVSGIFHIGMYIGDGLFVHAANSNEGVIISSLSENYYNRNYFSAKRVLGYL